MLLFNYDYYYLLKSARDASEVQRRVLSEELEILRASARRSDAEAGSGESLATLKRDIAAARTARDMLTRQLETEKLKNVKTGRECGDAVARAKSAESLLAKARESIVKERAVRREQTASSASKLDRTAAKDAEVAAKAMAEMKRAMEVNI